MQKQLVFFKQLYTLGNKNIDIYPGTFTCVFFCLS